MQFYVFLLLVKGTLHGAGTYRLRHFGDYKHIFGGPVPFNGTSSSFEVCTPSGLPLSASAVPLDLAAATRLVGGTSKDLAVLWEGCQLCV